MSIKLSRKGAQHQIVLLLAGLVSALPGIIATGALAFDIPRGSCVVAHCRCPDGREFNAPCGSCAGRCGYESPANVPPPQEPSPEEEERARRKNAAAKFADDARREMDNGNYDAAIEGLKAALDQTPDDSGLINLLNRAQNDKREEDERRARRAAQLADSAQREINNGNYEAAIRNLKAALGQTPDNSNLLDLLNDAQRYSGEEARIKLEDTISTLNAAIKKRTDEQRSETTIHQDVDALESDIKARTGFSPQCGKGCSDLLTAEGESAEAKRGADAGAFEGAADHASKAFDKPGSLSAAPEELIGSAHTTTDTDQGPNAAVISRLRDQRDELEKRSQEISNELSAITDPAEQTAKEEQLAKTKEQIKKVEKQMVDLSFHPPATGTNEPEQEQGEGSP